MARSDREAAQLGLDLAGGRSSLLCMTDVEVYVDPSCPWAWLTSRWVLEVAPARDLAVFWRSYCLEIRDDYGVAPTVPEEYRQRALNGHAFSHRMLRIFEAARAEAGEDAVGHLYTEWGRRFFLPKRLEAGNLLADCIAAAGLDATLIEAADDEKWDTPIRDSMEVAYAFGGPKTQTPTIVVRADPPHGFKGPVMAPAPQGEAALQLWDAIQVLSEYQGFFEISRPRANPPRVELTT
jgi:predicted DsbA family dithiol-disulfide isomerase